MRLAAAILITLLVTSAGCSDDPAPPPLQDGAVGCGPATCAGCCNGGACVLQTSAKACGKGGMECQVCSATQTCQAGACGGGTCDASTCQGCCKGGICMQGITSQFCGAGGAVCASCTSAQICTAGKCGKDTTCSASTCNGCCENNKCMPGSADAACGSGGNACADCAAAKGTCNAGVCTGGTTCTAASCSGCCKGNQCMPGSADTDCGKAGAACADCKATGGTCSAGACTGGATCGPSNCAGCCLGGVCITGLTDSGCGKGGVVCDDCKAKKQFCDLTARKCLACSASTCSGCCTTTGDCAFGSSATACGKGGVSCQQCLSYQTCLGGGCKINSTSKWNLKISKATILQTKTWDPWLIGNSRKPDPFATWTLSSSTYPCTGVTMINCTTHVNNTYAPTWPASIGVFSGTYLKVPCITIADQDSTMSGFTCPTGSDIIGVCAPTITAADIAKGYVELTSCPHPTSKVNYISNIRLEFTPK